MYDTNILLVSSSLTVFSDFTSLKTFFTEELHSCEKQAYSI